MGVPDHEGAAESSFSAASRAAIVSAQRPQRRSYACRCASSLRLRPPPRGPPSPASSLRARDALLQGWHGACLLRRAVQRGCSLREALDEVGCGAEARREYKECGAETRHRREAEQDVGHVARQGT